jgi:hypothetical protein
LLFPAGATVRPPRNSSSQLKVNAGTAPRDRSFIAADGLLRWSRLMSSLSYHSSRPDGWVQPRPHQDASLRYMKHGPIQPMEEPGFLTRLFGRH